MAAHTSDITFSLVRSPPKGRRRARGASDDAPDLREIPIFANVEEATLARLAQDTKVEAFEDGAVIFRQGDPVSAVVVILRGFIKLMRIASTGEETLIAIRSDGETVGDPPTNAKEIYRLSAEAVGPTLILRLPATRFAALMSESPALGAAMTQDAKNKIAAFILEIEALKAQNSDQRLARFILSLCPPGEERCRFRLPYDKRLIANRLGVKQETLSRAFAKLREHGVRTETRDVLVESVSRLSEHCDKLGL